MNPQNQIAFKEWAVVCAALGQGRQSLILRKGGIHEGREGFRVQHGEFWLFPTGFHQQADDVTPDTRPLLEQVQAAEASRCESYDKPRISISNYAVVSDTHYVTDLTTLRRLSGRHVWSEKILEQRFHYREPGLFALVVRVYRREVPIELDLTPHMSGCKSWVDLPSSISTNDLQPLLNDEAFERERLEIKSLLTDSTKERS